MPLYNPITDVTPAPHTHDTSEITTSRFGMARMPDMGLNKIMVGQGAGLDPVEEDKPAKMATGSYTGDGAATRQITTGFQCHMVIIVAIGSTPRGHLSAAYSGDTYLYGVYWYASNIVATVGPFYCHATDGFVVPNTINYSGVTYRYTAFGV